MRSFEPVPLVLPRACTGAAALLDIQKIRELVEMMVANDLVEISLRDGEEEVNLRRPNARIAEVAPILGAAPNPANPGAIAPPPPPVAAPEPPPAPEPDETELVEIASPMVGTFYSSPDPNSSPFVNIGQQIQVGMVVCILEAMKVFNEIKAEVAGTVERILVKNAEPVEYGQPLFLVRPQ